MKHKKINHILLPGLGCGSLILIITIGTVAVVILNYIRQENKANSADLAYRLEFHLNNGKFSLLLQRSLGVSICIKILKANAVRFNQFVLYQYENQSNGCFSSRDAQNLSHTRTDLLFFVVFI